MLSCEITEIIKNAYFEEHLRTIASGVNIFLFNIINLITSNDLSRSACQSCSPRKICCAHCSSLRDSRQFLKINFSSLFFSFSWNVTVHKK